MPIEAEALKDWPYPEVDCPKCGKQLIPFMRGQVQRRKKTLLGIKQPYCAIICAACKEVIGWEDPHRALMDLERTTWIREEKRRTEERQRKSDECKARERVFTEDEPQAEDEEKTPWQGPGPTIRAHNTMKIRAAALASCGRMPDTGSTSSAAWSSASSFYPVHPQGCMCNNCHRLRIKSTL